jgi:hypothetical protein
MKLKRESRNQLQKLLFLAWKLKSHGHFPEWDHVSETVPTAVPEIEQPQGTVEAIKVKNKLKKRKK